MEKKEYQKLVKNITPKPMKKNHILLAFIIGLTLRIIFLPYNISYYYNSIIEVLQLQMFGILNSSQMYHMIFVRL